MIIDTSALVASRHRAGLPSLVRWTKKQPQPGRLRPWGFSLCCVG
jgi:hypothetical protein